MDLLIDLYFGLHWMLILCIGGMVGVQLLVWWYERKNKND